MRNLLYDEAASASDSSTEQVGCQSSSAFCSHLKFPVPGFTGFTCLQPWARQSSQRLCLQGIQGTLQALG